MKEITTGRNSDKFGLTGKEVISLIGKYKNSKYLSLKCLSVHIGSQITSNTPYSRMLRVVQRIIDKSTFLSKINNVNIILIKKAKIVADNRR